MKLSQISIKPLIETLRVEDIDDNTYFSNKYGNYISNSRLSKINPDQDGSPVEFFDKWGKTKLSTTSLEFGSWLHTLVLQPNDFFLTEVDRPTAKMGLMADYIYKKTHGKGVNTEIILEASDMCDYYRGKMSDKKIEKVLEECELYWKSRAFFEKNNKDTRIPIFTDPKNRGKLEACLEALNRDKKIQELLNPEGLLEKPIIDNEIAFLIDVLVEAPEHTPFILKIKSKLDNFSIDKESGIITVNDLKTTGDLVSNFAKEALIKYHYYREMALYSWFLTMAAKKNYGIDKPKIKSNFLVVETIPKFYTKVVPMTRELFDKGFKEFTRLLKLVAFYCMHGYEGFGITQET